MLAHKARLRSSRAAVLVTAVLALSTLSSCVSSRGPNFQMEDARRVEIGMTKAQVVATLGFEPSSVHEDAAGELWIWTHVTPSLSSKSFSVKFKDDKTVFINR